MKVNVNVTREDIQEGRNFDCHKCPIARAVTRALSGKVPSKAVVSVGIDLVSVSLPRSKKVLFTGTLPRKGVYFVATFDLGKKKRPCNFPLTLNQAPA